MKKTLLLIFGVAAIFGAFSFTTANTQSAYCNDDLVGRIISTGGSGGPALATVTNNASDCSAQVTFSSYEVFIQPTQPGWLDTQVLFDYETVILGPGQTQEISIDVPDCKAQLDIYKGEVVTDLVDGVGHPGLIDYAFTYDPLCIATPTLTCSPPTQTINSGDSATFSASGGTGSYSWTGGESPQTGTGSNFSSTFYGSGNRTVTVASGNQTATCAVTINEVIPTLTCSPPTQTINSGDSATFSASGGTGSYLWTGGESPQTGTGSIFSSSFYGSGNRTVTVTSGSQSAFCSVYIQQTNYYSLSCSPQHQNVEIDQWVDFSATGGDGEYSWSASQSASPTHGNNSNFQTRFSQSGYKTVTVYSGGQSAQCRVSIDEPYVPPYQNQDFQVTKNVLNRTLNQSVFVNRVNAQTEDVVEFEIRVSSDAYYYQNNQYYNNQYSILVRDMLPYGLTYIPGTTQVNSVQAQDGITTSGIYINSSTSGASQYIRFLARVNGSVPSGTLTNQVSATMDGVTKNAWAYVDLVPRGVVLGAASIITGPEENSWLISIGLGFLTALLLFHFVFRRRFDSKKYI